MKKVNGADPESIHPNVIIAIEIDPVAIRHRVEENEMEEGHTRILEIIERVVEIAKKEILSIQKEDVVMAMGIMTKSIQRYCILVMYENVISSINEKISILQTEEDEETRAYRLEIEKQKALREKVLRDKEMRRRQAAEDIKKEEVNIGSKVQND